MKYSELGLVNTKDMLRDALALHYAVGAFNVYNMETLNAILTAARNMSSPVILAVSESALDYMGNDMLMAMVHGARIQPNENIALHLDHGHSFDICARAIDLGFSSVMIDASALSFNENIELSARVAEYAHLHNVSTEAELGTLGGHEDQNTNSNVSEFTDPEKAAEFVSRTGIDSLAVSIGTKHGAHKMPNNAQELRFDILTDIIRAVPDFPLVLHGASTIPQYLIRDINAHGGNITGAIGIPTGQLQRATEMNIAKINIDSDSRLAFTAGVRDMLWSQPNIFNPREYMAQGMEMVRINAEYEIENIMNSANRLK